MSKYIGKSNEITQEFNKFDFEKRKEIIRYSEGHAIVVMEQLKAVLNKNHKRLLAEITSWQNNLLEGIKEEEANEKW